NPDDIVCFEQRLQAICEELVYAEITSHFAPAIFRQIQPVMADRPKDAVGETLIIFFDIKLGQIRQRIVDIAVCYHLQRADGVSLAGLPGPSQPHPAACLERRVKSDSQTASRRRPIVAWNWNTVRNYDKTT